MIFYCGEFHPLEKSVVGCLGPNIMLLLFLHYADWKFENGVLLFHGLMESHSFLCLTRTNLSIF